MTFSLLYSLFFSPPTPGWKSNSGGWVCDFSGPQTHPHPRYSHPASGASAPAAAAKLAGPFTRTRPVYNRRQLDPHSPDNHAADDDDDYLRTDSPAAYRPAPDTASGTATATGTAAGTAAGAYSDYDAAPFDSTHPRTHSEHVFSTHQLLPAHTDSRLPAHTNSGTQDALAVAAELQRERAVSQAAARVLAAVADLSPGTAGRSRGGSFGSGRGDGSGDCRGSGDVSGGSGGSSRGGSPSGMDLQGLVVGVDERMSAAGRTTPAPLPVTISALPTTADAIATEAASLLLRTATATTAAAATSPANVLTQEAQA
jgi:hypothetical protein